jgi:thioredoxin reductase (NADPH)
LNPAQVLDCLVIGGGPAGLTAAIYLSRFRRRALVIDGGWSRAAWITRSHNLPGFPAGIEGPALLERLREQALLYGGTIRKGYVDALRRGEDGLFVADLDGAPLIARTVLLATGVVETEPLLPHVADAVKRGLIRTCPICDGYEAIDKKVAVLGTGEHAAAEALFLRTYTDRLSLLLAGGAAPLTAETSKALDEAGVEVGEVRTGAVRLDEDGATALTQDGQTHRFDIIYSAFGTIPQTALAQSLGARLDASGRLYVTEHQATSVEALYAAGDVVRGLNQISVAEGEATIAATAIHNRLAKVPA